MTLGKNLTTGPIALHLFKLTIPMFLGISSMIIASMADAVYIGQISSLQLAAIGFCFPFIMLIVGFYNGLGIGCASLVAQAAGSGDYSRVRQLSTYSLVLVTLITVASGLAVHEYRFTLLAYLGAENEVLLFASDFMHIWLLGYLPFVLSLTVGNLMRAVGEANLPGLVMVAGSVLQIIVSPFLVFGLAGLPRLEIEGAAWGFTISRIFTLFFTLWILLRNVPLLSFERIGWMKIVHIWRQVLRVGLPAAAANMIAPVSLAIVTAVLATTSALVVASFSIASRIEALVTMVMIALATSIVPFVAQNWGASQPERARQALQMTYYFCLIYGTCIAAVLMLAGRFFIALITKDTDVVDIAYLNILWVAWTFSFLGSAQVSYSVFLALGQARATMIMSLIRIFLIYTPLILLGNYYFSYVGVFIAIAATNLIMAVIAYYWADRFFMRQIKSVFGLASADLKAQTKGKHGLV